MKKLLISLSITLTVLTACQKEKLYKSSPSSDYCDVIDEITCPDGFEITHIGQIDYNGGIKRFQFITQNIGYALARSNVGGHPDILKTVDGGIHWELLPFEVKGSAQCLFFINSQIGFLSYYYFTFPSNILNSVLLRTVDGGNNWTPINSRQLNGTLQHIQKHKSGALFGFLNRTQPAIVRSDDNGLHWRIICSSPDFHFELVTFSYKLAQDWLYVAGENGKLFQISLAGRREKTIQTNQDYFWDLKVIDENNLVIVGSGQTIKTIDGGNTWTTIYNRHARLINFTSPDVGFMILNNSYCPTDVYQANDVIAYTKNGGLDWSSSQESTNLMMSFKGSQHMKWGGNMIFFKNKLYRIQKRIKDIEN